MFDFASDTRKIIQIVLPFVAALILISASRATAQAETNHMLVIPASDGYDFEDCLSGGKACGRTIADAWCEAHGMSASISFGRADDITASIPTTDSTHPLIEKAAIAPKFAPGSFVVNCRD